MLHLPDSNDCICMLHLAARQSSGKMQTNVGLAAPLCISWTSCEIITGFVYGQKSKIIMLG